MVKVPCWLLAVLAWRCGQAAGQRAVGAGRCGCWSGCSSGCSSGCLSGSCCLARRCSLVCSRCGDSCWRRCDAVRVLLPVLVRALFECWPSCCLVAQSAVGIAAMLVWLWVLLWVLVAGAGQGAGQGAGAVWSEGAFCYQHQQHQPEQPNPTVQQPSLTPQQPSSQANQQPKSPRAQPNSAATHSKTPWMLFKLQNGMTRLAPPARGPRSFCAAPGSPTSPRRSPSPEPRKAQPAVFVGKEMKFREQSTSSR